MLQNEVKRLGTDPVQGEELKSRRAVLTGGYARNMETNAGFAGQIAALTTYNLPLKTINEFIPAINAVTTADVTQFAKAHFAEPASLIVVGRAPAFLEPLKKALPDVRVIAQGDLDLNRAELVKGR